ncbi:MAG: hypothetical protein ACE5HM_02070 [Acidiferrobacterales bacterium]
MEARAKWLWAFVSVAVLTVGSTSRSAQTIDVSDQPVQGCPLVLGDASFDTTVSHDDKALLLKMETVRYGSCSRFKTLRLITPEGKKLKPRKIKPKRSGRTSISIGVGRRSGGSSSTGGSVFVQGGPSGGYGVSNYVTYVFERGLPEGALGSDWIWAIKTFDRCTRTKEELHVPVDYLISCQPG